MIKISVCIRTVRRDVRHAVLPVVAHAHGQAEIGAAVKGMAVAEGLGGVEPGSPPKYIAMGHLFCESLDGSSSPSRRTGPISLPTFRTTRTRSRLSRSTKCGCSDNEERGAAIRSTIAASSAIAPPRFRRRRSLAD